MSSPSKTKSLDRDFSHRKTKAPYPQNVLKVCNIAEHSVCHYHNEIEDVFGNYPINKFSEDLTSDRVTELMKILQKISDFNDSDLSNINKALADLCPSDYKNDQYFILSRYVDFVIVTDKLLSGINSKLSQMITRGLIQYCVSLADYCTSDISFIVNYEKIIQRNRPEIIKEVKDIRKEYTDYKKVTSSVKSILYRCHDVIDSVSRIRASINKLYYLVTEWVDEERNYASNLSAEMKAVKFEILSIQQRSDSLRDSINQRQLRLANLDKHIEVLRKNQSILRRKHHRIRNSRQQIDGMIKQLENQATLCDSELDTMNKKLNNLQQQRKKSKKKINHQNLSPELNSTKSEQKDLRTKQSRLEDNKLALDRHRERLEKVDNDMCERLAVADKEIVSNESTRDRLLKGLKEDNDVQVNDLERLKILYPTMEDLNFVFSRKNSPETLRQLHNHGRLIVQTKELKFVDKMCDVVAKAVADNWRELYLNLPFYPSRSKDKRFSDIEVIDLVSARSHNDGINQAIMSLNKWRLFYHNAGPEHLIEGLKKSKLNEIAKEMEEMNAKSKHRYEED